LNHAEFIEKNIISELTRLGYSIDACHIGARAGVAHYHRASQASSKGKLFDDCLRHARTVAEKHTS